MTNDKETVQEIINQLEVLQKEAFKKNKAEKNRKVVNLEIFKETSFKLIIGKQALKNEHKKLAELCEDETNE